MGKKRRKKKRKKRKVGRKGGKGKGGFAIISTVHRASPAGRGRNDTFFHYDFHAINHTAIAPIEFPIIRELFVKRSGYERHVIYVSP